MRNLFLEHEGHDGLDDHDAEHDFDDADQKNSFYYADNVELTTVGIDIGSSTSHLMFSRLHLQRLGQFLSSRYVVVERVPLHRSPILLTPYTEDYNIDVATLERFIRASYEEAGLKPTEIDSGAIILTGEALKRHNARAIADLFASEAGKFVCASAGHNLEAILAANGAGSLALSRELGQTILHVDVGGGTSKLALLRNGDILETAAINVGGRLVAMDDEGRLVRIEEAAHIVSTRLGFELALGERLDMEHQALLANAFGACLFEVMQRQELSPLAQDLMLTPAFSGNQPIDAITFSGGVSEFIYEREERDFGDISRPLSAAVRSLMERNNLPMPERSSGERIRATVIGASQFTVQVSGNTISISDTQILPLRNIQVINPKLPEAEEVQPEILADAIARGFQRFDLTDGDQPIALAVNWAGTPRYQLLRSIAEGIVRGAPRTIELGLPLVVVFVHDFGKLIGDILREEFNVRNVISIDNIELQEFDFIDVGEVVYPANVVPVVVKSLVFPTVEHPHAELVASA